MVLSYVYISMNATMCRWWLATRVCVCVLFLFFIGGRIHETEFDF